MYTVINLRDTNIKGPLEVLQHACFIESTYVDIWCLFLLQLWKHRSQLKPVDRTWPFFAVEQHACSICIIYQPFGFTLVFGLILCLLLIVSVYVVEWIFFHLIGYYFRFPGPLRILVFGFHCHVRSSIYSKADAEFKNAMSERVAVTDIRWGCNERDSPISVFGFIYPPNETFQYAISVLTD